MAIAGSIGLVKGIKENRHLFSSTNSLKWKPQEIVAKELTGFNQKSKTEENGSVTANFEPVFKEINVGTWMRPEIVAKPN